MILKMPTHSMRSMISYIQSWFPTSELLMKANKHSTKKTKVRLQGRARRLGPDNLLRQRLKAAIDRREGRRDAGVERAEAGAELAGPPWWRGAAEKPPCRPGALR